MKRSPWADYLLFSLSSYAATVAALFIAFAIGLPRPFWAMATVYILGEPLAGAVRSKGVYRMLGTFLGAAVAIALVPNLVNRPLALTTALSLWVAFCVYFSSLDRSPRAYALLLAGYTATIIGFPVVDAPENVWDVSVARCEEIGLGIICTTVIRSLVFPRPVSAAIADRVQAWLADIDRWALDALAASEEDEREARQSHDAAAVAAQVQTLAAHLPFDVNNRPVIRGRVAALWERMVMIIPTVAGLTDRMRALTADGGRLNPSLAAATADTAAWIRGGPSRAAGEPIAERFDRLTLVRPGSGWRALLSASLAARTATFLRLRMDAADLLPGIRDPDVRTPPLAGRVARLPVDPRTALASALGAFSALMAVCVFWIVSGWPEGAGAAVITSLASSLFGARDDLKAALAFTGSFLFVAAPLAALYDFVILPSISGFPMLALALAPPLLLCGVMMAHPRLGPFGLAIALTFSLTLALQETYSAEFQPFANNVVAQLLGLLATVAGARVFRTVRDDAAVRRILRLTWRDLAVQAAQPVAPEPAKVSARLIDRVAALAPKLASTEPRRDPLGDEALRELRAGLALLLVQQARPGAAPKVGERLDTVFGGIAAYFRGLASTGQAEPAPERLRADIDAGLAEWIDAPRDFDQTHGLLGLVGVRRSLFPGSPHFRRPPKGALP